MPNQDTKLSQEVVVLRLHSTAYKQLEDKMSRLAVTTTTTPIEAGFQLGVQAVLKELRAGYVVQTGN